MHPDPGGKDRNDIEKNDISGNGFFGVSEIRERNELVGCFGLHPFSREICELRKIYLLKESRGKGLGKFILDRAIQIAREKDTKKSSWKPYPP